MRAIITVETIVENLAVEELILRVWDSRSKRRFDETKPRAFVLSKGKLIFRKIMSLIRQSENILSTRTTANH